MNATYYPAATLRLILLVFTVFLLGLVGTLLAAAQSGPADKEKPLASDKDIAAAIENHLSADPAVPSHLIDVEVKNGITTLSGSVDNLLARDHAGEVAETIRGVRSVVNTITVDPVKRPDDEITKGAKIALVADPATDLYETGVQVTNGAAILTGTVDSLAERHLAGEVVKSVKGVTAVKNDLVVKPKLKRPDAQVAADIKGMLKQDPWVDASSVDVTVKDGVATLKGAVGSMIERTEAITTARLTGVTRIEADGLTVKPGSTLSRTTRPLDDKELTQLIETAMSHHPRLASFKPEVKSNNHIVTLAGVVDNLAAKKIAGEIAQSTTGVTKVENNIKVQPKKLADDAALAKEVKNALLRDPYVSRFDMNVSASSSKVNLEGKVDSAFEKNYAEFVASRVPGVVDVQNSLKVVGLEVPRKTDSVVQEQIEYGLRWSPYVDSKGIAVSVKDGIATLSGNASSWQEKIAATQIAQRAGAESVLNQVKVKDQSS
jgi:osmotically-inducible protein OsmY